MTYGEGCRLAISLLSEEMGFLRQQEVSAAVRLLKWQYERASRKPPAEDVLRRQAGQIVDDAHRIAKERGRNVITIMRELIENRKER